MLEEAVLKVFPEGELELQEVLRVVVGEVGKEA
jgi:hypothetical protein